MVEFILGLFFVCFLDLEIGKFKLMQCIFIVEGYKIQLIFEGYFFIYKQYINLNLEINLYMFYILVIGFMSIYLVLSFFCCSCLNGSFIIRN